MMTATQEDIRLGGRRVAYSVVRSPSATRLRARVGLGGLEILRPPSRGDDDVVLFLKRNQAWVLGQLDRVNRLGKVRRRSERKGRQLLLRGEAMALIMQDGGPRSRSTRVAVDGGKIVVRRGGASETPLARSLERWLRTQARADIERHLATITARLRRRPNRVYVMGQRTKWGNCSSRGNLSFNWRLVLAPRFVLRYLVAHEAVHLAVADHSTRFWLTLRSVCPESEPAKAWLRANGERLLHDSRALLSDLRDHPLAAEGR